MFNIFTVSYVADICGVSVQMIYKRIKSFSVEELNLYLNQTNKKFKQITPEGLNYFKSIYLNNKNNNNDIISLLTEQLRIKDEQISILMEQNRNFQVLLKTEKDKYLPPPKTPFFKRLFGKVDK